MSRHIQARHACTGPVDSNGETLVWAEDGAIVEVHDAQIAADLLAHAELFRDTGAPVVAEADAAAGPADEGAGEPDLAGAEAELAAEADAAAGKKGAKSA